MKLVRRIMRDRSSAGAVAVLALLLFLLQGLANGVANGSMAAAALAGNEIICSAHTPEGGSSRPAPAQKSADGCCGALCRLAAASFAALLVSPAEVAGQVVPRVDVVPWHWNDAKSSPPPNREQQPRAPPSAPHA